MGNKSIIDESICLSLASLIESRIKQAEIGEPNYPRKPPVVDLSADKILFHQT